MKIRNGFVSNSSSSSFIVSVKVGKPCEHCGRSDDNLLGLIKNHKHYDEDSLRQDNKKDVLKAIEENFYFGTDAEKQEVIKKVKKAKGEVLVLDVSYHDEEFIDLLENTPSITVLHKDCD